MLVFIILFAVLAVISFFLFGGLRKAFVNDEYEQGKVKLFGQLRIMVPGILLGLVMIVSLISGIKIIDSTEVGVVRTFGEINRQISSGLNFVNPISDSVTTYDLRVHVRQDAFASYTKDAQPLTASVEYQYALDPAYVMDVAREYGSYEILETKLANVVQEKAKVVFAKYSAMTLLENRSTLSAEVTDEVKTLEELYHVRFTSVIVQDIDFSDAFEASVEAKMTAEQDALRAEQEKKTAIIQAEQEKEVAAIEAEAAIAKAKGEAEAMQITREALQNMPDAYIQQMWIEKWNGELPTVQAGDSASVIVNPGMKDAG